MSERGFVRAGSHGTHIIAYRPKACASLAMSSFTERARAHRSWVSGRVQTHAPQVRHLASKLRLEQNLSKKRADTGAYYLCGAHQANGTPSTLEICVLSTFCQNSGVHLCGVHHADRVSASLLESGLEKSANRARGQNVWCTPRRSIQKPSAGPARARQKNAPNRDLELAKPQRQGLVYS